jgi:MFS superfamily sulfate permease-like transporter
MRRGDLIAGLSVAGLLLPEAVAYAGIAGLQPQRAILAAIAGCLVYWVFGRSRFAIVSPTSSSAAILAATLTAVPGDDAVKAAAATVVVALVAMFFLLAAAAQLGALTGFISRPVLRGFAFGLAVTIIIRQLPLLVGVPVHEPDIFRTAAGLATALPHWNPASVVIGIAALVALLLLRRVPAAPGAFLVLAAGIATSLLFGLPRHGVAVVGRIDALPSWPAWPSLTRPDYALLAQFSLPLVLILFAEPGARSAPRRCAMEKRSNQTANWPHSAYRTRRALSSRACRWAPASPPVRPAKRPARRRGRPRSSPRSGWRSSSPSRARWWDNCRSLCSRPW